MIIDRQKSSEQLSESTNKKYRINQLRAKIKPQFFLKKSTIQVDNTTANQCENNHKDYIQVIQSPISEEYKSGNIIPKNNNTLNLKNLPSIKNQEEKNNIDSDQNIFYSCRKQMMTTKVLEIEDIIQIDRQKLRTTRTTSTKLLPRNNYQFEKQRNKQKQAEKQNINCQQIKKVKSIDVQKCRLKKCVSQKVGYTLKGLKRNIL